MEMKDYSWHFSTVPPLSKPRDPSASRVLHTDLKKYLSDLQTSEFFHACSYFNLTIELQYNGKPTFTINMDKNKFTLMEVGTGKAISLEKFATPACTAESLIRSLECFKTLNILDVDKCDSLIEALRIAI